MTGHYLAEFSCSYRPVKHGRPGVSAMLLRLTLPSDSHTFFRLVQHTVSYLTMLSFMTNIQNFSISFHPSQVECLAHLAYVASDNYHSKYMRHAYDYQQHQFLCLS
jgi:hypothetical protein